MFYRLAGSSEGTPLGKSCSGHHTKNRKVNSREAIIQLF